MVVNLQEFSTVELRYSQLILERNYSYDVRLAWDVIRPDKTLLDFTPLTSIETRESGNFSAIYSFNEDKAISLIDFSTRRVAVSIASSDQLLIEEHIRDLQTLFPIAPDNIDGKVKVRFWYNTRHGPKNVLRTIGVPKWDQIEQNYDPETFKGLAYLMKTFKPTSGGQLIIMNGIPGTGKSYFLRALLHEWKDWCTAEYILDPENLFSGGQEYMADLVLQKSFDDENDYVSDENDEANKWKLLILEDSGDLLKVDAQLHVGSQGLARLLNLVDGLIGQGLRVLVLITTNEPIDKMHEAVTRDGRCAATITFNALRRDQAVTWMNGSAPNLPEGKDRFTLAELYALTKGKKVRKSKPEPRGFGFKMP